jgi:hypothetical protein
VAELKKAAALGSFTGRCVTYLVRIREICEGSAVSRRRSSGHVWLYSRSPGCQTLQWLRCSLLLLTSTPQYSQESHVVDHRNGIFSSERPGAWERVSELVPDVSEFEVHTFTTPSDSARTQPHPTRREMYVNASELPLNTAQAKFRNTNSSQTFHFPFRTPASEHDTRRTDIRTPSQTTVDAAFRLHPQTTTSTPYYDGSNPPPPP